MDLGFKEKCYPDGVYFKIYGYEYTVIRKKLTKHIYLDWAKETRLCKIVRAKKGRILAEKAITTLEELESIIEFFGKLES